MGNWEVHLKDRIDQYMTDVFIFRRTNDRGFELLIGREIKYFSQGSDIPPSLSIEHDMLAPLMEALFAKGVKPKQSSFTEGKLEATNKHLEDMRSLVFKKKVI